MANIFTGGFKEKTGKDSGNSTKEHWNFTAGTFDTKRIFEGPWENRLDFIFTDLIGEFFDTGSNTLYNFPATYPDIPYAFVDDITVEGAGAGDDNTVTKQAKWDRAIVEVTYKSQSYSQGSGKGLQGGQASLEDYTKSNFLDESLESSIEFINVPGEDVKKKSDDTPLFDHGPHSIPLILMTLEIRQVNIIRPIWDAVASLMGKVNDNAFISPSGFSADKETLRYDGPSGFTKVNVHSLGGEDFPLPLWEITHRFVYNRLGWNKKLVDGEFVDVVLAGDKPIFEKADLYALYFGAGSGPDRDILSAISTELSAISSLLSSGASYNDELVQNSLALINGYKADLGFRG